MTRYTWQAITFEVVCCGCKNAMRVTLHRHEPMAEIVCPVCLLMQDRTGLVNLLLTMRGE